MTRPLSSINLALNRANTAAAMKGIPAGLTCWLDPSDDTKITEAAGEVSGFTQKLGTASWDQVTPANRPSLTTIGARQGMNYDGSDTLGLTSGDITVVQPGSGDFTIGAVYSATNSVTRGCIWTQDGAGKRWLLRTELNGSDLLFSIDDNTVAQSIVATDVDFSNGTLYYIIASRDGTNIRLYYSSGGALVESAASPVAIGAYGDIDAANGNIGDFTTGSQSLIGDAGDLMFWKRALDADERTNLLNAWIDRWT